MPRDLFWNLGAIALSRTFRLAYGYWEHSAPKVWDAPDDYHVVRRVAERALPGVQYRRHVLWRYSLRWLKPRSG